MDRARDDPTSFPRRPATSRIISSPHLSHGRTGIAALASGRSYVGIELSEEYSELQRQILARVVFADGEPPENRTIHGPLFDVV